jgi:hypothetical protein
MGKPFIEQALDVQMWGIKLILQRFLFREDARRH